MKEINWQIQEKFITNIIMKKINESFTCISCGKQVPLASKTCRNHCPYCFVSLHVDWKLPWDRDTDCGWTMYPTCYERRNWKIKILFQCIKCDKLHRNKALDDDEIWNLDSYISEYKKHFLLWK